MDETPWTEALAASGELHGALSLRQARLLGVPDSTYYQRTRREGAAPEQRGVVVPAPVRRDFLTRASAAVQSVGGRVALTGVTSLFVQGVVDEPPAGLHLAVPSDRARPSLRGTDDVIRTRTLAVSDIVVVRDLPCLSVAWSLLHAGRTEGRQRVLALYIAAEQRNLLTRAQVTEVLERCGRPPGRAALAAAHRRRSDDTAVDSKLELDTRDLLVRSGFVAHPTPFPFRCPDGRVIHLDVPFPGAWFALECETPRSHGSDRAFEIDRLRWSQAQRGGWDLDWVTRERLTHDPTGIVETVRQAVEAASSDRPAPVPTPCRQARCRICPPLREG